MEMRAHVIVSGEVQGVFFRSETQKKARECHVKGWVRNLPDGRVEAVFQGEDDDVKKLIDFCRVGPPRATVTKVKVDWEEASEEFKDFHILR